MPNLAAQKKSVWEGAYTSEQADRGEKAYASNCGGCHQADLGGKGEFPALKGDNFMERWHDYAVKPLFDMVRTEMPPLRFRTPETKQLPDNVYVDIITYIFGYLGRGFAAGDLEGHRILVKGYIIRQREFERISVTSVTDIAPGCE